MLLSDILDTKIIDDEAKLEGAGGVFPYTGSVVDFIISMR